MVKFGGLQKTSLIDYPGRISSILFTPGCNLRCPYCHNWRLVLNPKGPFLSEDEVLQILRSRKRYVDAVVITGGEPTIHRDLPDFLKRLKEDDFAVKLDTNGFFPDVLKECLPYVDYVALDVKTTVEKYRLLGAKEVESYLETVRILKDGKIDYEFRVTVVPGFVDEKDIPGICEIVKGAKRLALQQFIPDDTLDRSFSKVKPYPAETIKRFAKVMGRYVGEVILRI